MSIQYGIDRIVTYCVRSLIKETIELIIVNVRRYPFLYEPFCSLVEEAW